MEGFMVNGQVLVRFGWLVDPTKNLSRFFVFFLFLGLHFLTTTQDH